MAREMGLMEGVPVATCIIDAHASLPGCGIGEPGKMMIIVGTSSVHMMLGDKEVSDQRVIRYSKRWNYARIFWI